MITTQVQTTRIQQLRVTLDRLGITYLQTDSEDDLLELIDGYQEAQTRDRVRRADRSLFN